jgi:hypothetical protein
MSNQNEFNPLAALIQALTSAFSGPSAEKVKDSHTEENWPHFWRMNTVEQDDGYGNTVEVREIQPMLQEAIDVLQAEGYVILSSFVAKAENLKKPSITVIPMMIDPDDDEEHDCENCPNQSFCPKYQEMQGEQEEKSEIVKVSESFLSNVQRGGAAAAVAYEYLDTLHEMTAGHEPKPSRYDSGIISKAVAKAKTIIVEAKQKAAPKPTDKAGEPVIKHTSPFVPAGHTIH